MNIAHLKYFSELAALKSYTKAAKELYITQPTLTAAIQSLEQEIGFSLFEKTGRQIELTDRGKIFNTHIEIALREIDNGITKGRVGLDQAQDSLIRIGAASLDQNRFLSSIVQLFQAEVLPSANIKVVKCPPGHVADMLKAGDIEIGFVFEKTDDEILRFTQGLSCDIIAYVSKSSPLAAHTSFSIEELSYHNLISYRKDLPQGKVIFSWFKQVGLRAVPGYEDVETLHSLVLANPDRIAVALVPVGWERELLKVKQIPIVAPNKIAHAYAATKTDKPLDNVTSLFLNFLHARTSQ